ncbi:MAG: hypothetical protein KC550_02120 [Nanoarchaeota archaeon]|nr:hypothetical protein [Nanoarchaeota archaeon]
MVIDIDSFLEKYSQDEGFNENPEDENQEEKVERIDLDFQKDVEDKIYKVSKKAETADFTFLKKIYDEVKRFDEDIPTKFLGIEHEGDNLLKNLGGKYSNDFVKKVKENIAIIENAVNQKVIELDNLIQTENYIEIAERFEELIRFYNLAPREFIRKKIEVGKILREREVIINEKMIIYKNRKLIEIKKILNKELIELNRILKPGFAKEIEDKISKIHYLVNSISKLFLSDLSKEKIYISKMLMKAETYLEQEYENEFKQKTAILHNLFEKFHNYLIDKNLEETLISYDEIILHFKTLPDVFLEEKIAIFNQINEMYSSVNNLVIGNSVSTFLKTYSYSKVFEEVRDYLRLVSVTKKLNTSNLNKLKEKLDSIPDEANPEKIDLTKKVNYLLNVIGKSINNIQVNQAQAQTQTQNKPNPKEIDLNKIPRPEDRPRQAEDTRPEFKAEPIQKKNLNKDFLEQINMHYEILKKTNNPKELKIIYKKIMFYLNLTPLSESVKRELILKVNKTLNEKKLS